MWGIPTLCWPRKPVICRAQLLRASAKSRCWVNKIICWTKNLPKSSKFMIKWQNFEQELSSNASHKIIHACWIRMLNSTKFSAVLLCNGASLKGTSMNVSVSYFAYLNLDRVKVCRLSFARLRGICMKKHESMRKSPLEQDLAEQEQENRMLSLYLSRAKCQDGLLSQDDWFAAITKASVNTTLNSTVFGSNLLTFRSGTWPMRNGL